MRIKLLYFFFFLTSSIFAQEENSAYERFSDQYVWFGDLGFSTGPASLKIPKVNGIENLTLRNNSRLVIGVGFSYKWITLRLSSGLLGNLRPLSRYGKTQYFDLGFDFTLKKRFFFDVDFHLYKGYTYKNAYQWNDTITELKRNLYDPELSTASFSLNTWHFFSDDFNMPSFRGKTGMYKRDIATWYVRYSINYYGIGNEMGIIPTEIRDTMRSITEAKTVAAFDLGAIPGYAIVKRYKDLQFGLMAGLGGTIQSKVYITNEFTRGYLGLAPRVDFKITAGWNKPRWFAMLVTDFDNKGIRFRDLRYRQTYYTIKVVAGIRLDKKKKS